MEVEIVGGTVEIDELHVEESPAEIRRQLREYERDERQTFDLSIDGPESFTGAVMEQLLTVPYGETRTYGEIARALDTTPVPVRQECVPIRHHHVRELLSTPSRPRQPGCHSHI